MTIKRMTWTIESESGEVLHLEVEGVPLVAPPPVLPEAALRVCRELARREADYRREVSGPDTHDYVKHQDEAELEWQGKARWCQKDHGKDAMAHPGCLLCESVHGLRYVPVG
jgi:hypothetical protein